MLTKKMIDDDVDKIREMLREHDFVIPGIWTVTWPVLVFFMIPPVLQIFFSLEVSPDSGRIQIEDYFPVFFSAFITLMVSLATLSFRARYLSLPEVVRTRSAVINLLLFKVKFYGLLWMSSYICIGLCVLLSVDIEPSVSAVGLLCTLFLTVMFFNIDMARFELSALNKIYDLWKDNRL